MFERFFTNTYGTAYVGPSRKHLKLTVQKISKNESGTLEFQGSPFKGQSLAYRRIECRRYHALQGGSRCVFQTEKYFARHNIAELRGVALKGIALYL